MGGFAMRYTHRNEFFGGLVYDRVTKEYFYLDHLANRLVTDPDRPLTDHEYSSFETTINEVQELRSDFHSRGLTHALEFRNNRPLASGLSAPIRVFYEITYQCPERCQHCYTSSAMKDSAELSLTEKLSIVDQMAAIGCFRISIAGGEPLIDGDFFPLVEHALDEGIDVSFSTSAIPGTDAIARRLDRLDVRTINVSLDGWNEETYGAVRGRGRFPFVERGVRRLREHYSKTIAAKCTLMKTNLGCLEEIIDYAERAGFDKIKFNCVREAGRAEGANWILPTQDEYIAAMRRLSALYNSWGRKIKLVLPLNPYQHRSHRASAYIEELGFGCYAGKESFCVNPVGDIQPCSSFGRGVYSDGNIRTRTLLDAWLNGTAMQLFRGMDGSSACKSCSSYDGCKGGCYLRSYQATGDIRATDPYCYEYANVDLPSGRIISLPVIQRP
jgi:radical SAM protein with 4Fe4S-binding SPASM domain